MGGLSVCLFLSCTKLCPVLVGTAGASMDSTPELVPCEQAAPLPISLPACCQKGIASRGCNSLHFLRLSPAYCFCHHINMEQLKSLSWLWASLCWMCSWMLRPLKHTDRDVSHEEGQHQGYRYVWSFCPAIFSISKSCTCHFLHSPY